MPVYEYMFELIANGGTRCPMSIYIDIHDTELDGCNPPSSVINAIQSNVNRLCRDIEETNDLSYGMIELDWSLPLELVTGKEVDNEADVVV